VRPAAAALSESTAAADSWRLRAEAHVRELEESNGERSRLSAELSHVRASAPDVRLQCEVADLRARLEAARATHEAELQSQGTETKRALEKQLLAQKRTADELGQDLELKRERPALLEEVAQLRIGPDRQNRASEAEVARAGGPARRAVGGAVQSTQ
jgi:hypothetical protein